MEQLSNGHSIGAKQIAGKVAISKAQSSKAPSFASLLVGAVCAFKRGDGEVVRPNLV
jgi:hypothetical protein